MPEFKYTKYRPKWCKHPPFEGPFHYCWGLALSVDRKERKKFLSTKCADCELSRHYIVKEKMFDRTKEILERLTEMREVCAACFRVIYNGNLVNELEAELKKMGIKDGFGIRCQELIRELKGRKCPR